MHWETKKIGDLEPNLQYLRGICVPKRSMFWNITPNTWY
jgi:hypothetical protein